MPVRTGKNFGTELAEDLADLRELAEMRMTTSLVIERKTATTAPTLENGFKTTDVLVPVYGSHAAPGKGWVRFQQMLGGALQAKGGGNVEVYGNATLHIPWDAPPARPGDLVTILASPHNPNLNGKQLVIASSEPNSMATAARYSVKDSQAGSPTTITGPTADYSGEG